jgi:hypothetical protein
MSDDGWWRHPARRRPQQPVRPNYLADDLLYARDEKIAREEHDATCAMRARGRAEKLNIKPIKPGDRR